MIETEQAFLASERFCAAFNTLATPKRFSAGESVFVRGEPSRGVFLVSSGRVALSVGNEVTTKEAGPGSALGLPATVAQIDYVLSAQALSDAELGFVPCEQFLSFLEKQPDLSLEVVQILGTELQYACQSVFSQVRQPESLALRAELARQRLLATHTVKQPIGLRRARQLLSELKREYDGLSRSSRGIIARELESCAERQSLREETAQQH